MKNKTLNDCDKETIEKNFLQEEQYDLPNEKVHVYHEVPKTCKIVFMNNRDPGAPLYFHYRSKTHPLHHYELHHGQTYDLPIEVAQHLEGQRKGDEWACHKRMYARRMRQDGVSEVYANQYVPYFQLKTVHAA